MSFTSKFCLLVVGLIVVFAVYEVAFAERTSVSSGSGVTTVGTCNTASSTLFYQQSPFTATSTATLITLRGTQGATTTDILLGTSTAVALSGTATSSLSENIMGLFSVPTSTQFTSVAGITLGPGTGYTQPAGGTYKTSSMVVVGPNEGILGFSTSTFGGSRNGGTSTLQVAIPACTYSITWYPIQ